MGTPLTAETLETHQYSASCLENSPSSSPPTLSWPSTSPRRDGTRSRTSRPRPVASPLLRLLPAPLNSTTSTAESTLVTGTPTRTSPRSSMPSSRTTTASPLTPSTPPTWTPRVVGNIEPGVPVHSTRIRVGRNIDGFGLSPGITKQQRIDVEKLMSNALSKLTGDLAGKYYPLTGMDEAVRQQLVDDHFLFVSGDRNLTVAGMERDWPEG